MSIVISTGLWSSTIQRPTGRGVGKTSRNWSWRPWNDVSRTTPRINVLSLHSCLDKSSRLVFEMCMKTYCKQYLPYILTFWRSSYGTVKNDLNNNLVKVVKLGMGCNPSFRKLVLKTVKRYLQNDFSVNVFIYLLKASLQDWSSRHIWRRFANNTLIARSMRRTCRPHEPYYLGPYIRTFWRSTYGTWIPALRDVSCQTCWKLVLKTLKRRHQNNIYPFYRCFEDPNCSSIENHLITSLERVQLGCRRLSLKTGFNSLENTPSERLLG